jgi:two-component system KDP operon response regulator KdpE
MRVLVVDNDAKLRAALVRVFETARMNVIAASYREVLDSRVPLDSRNAIALGGGGAEFAVVLRVIVALRAASAAPLVCYGSMHWSDIDRAAALDAGADALVDFPFDKTATLIAQLRALARRASGSVARPVIRIGRTEIDLVARKVTSGTVRRRLTRHEATILARLAADAPHVVPYAELYRALGCKLSIGESRAIKQAIVRVRKKLGDAAHAIEAVAGIGYRLLYEPAMQGRA